MAAPHPSVLLVDATPEAPSLMKRLSGAGFDVEIAANGQDALEATMAGHPFDVIITESDLEDGSGLRLLSALKARHPRLPVVMLGASGTSTSVIEAAQAGIFDYLTKPVDDDELTRVLHDAVRTSRLMSKPVEIGELYDNQDTIIGRSRAMTVIYKELGRVAAQPVTVLIRGETGTGKELIARAIYQHGHRAHRPFIAINCAAIPDPLLESELFGHEKGAFTGADKLRIGRFEQAHNGTLFLDEIGDLSLALQAKLLRVLQDRQIQRLGGRTEIPVDVRIIAATHRRLEQMVEEGTFRADLFYRLNVADITIPPLRERREDIAHLAHYFLARYARESGGDAPAITPQAMKFLEDQDWPGNVRQLQNVIWKALLNSRGYVIDWNILREIIEESERGPHSSASRRPIALRELVAEALRAAAAGESRGAYAGLVETLERELFAAALDRSHGNQAQAARWLGISRYTLREKLHRYGLHPADTSDSPDAPAE